MTKQPLLNALAAIVYISAIASFIFYVPKWLGLNNKPDTVLAPITILSLFVLSAAVMGYIFLYQPLQMYLDGKKKEGANLFIHTVGYFAGAVVIVLILLVTIH